MRLFANLGHKVLALGAALLLWGVSNTSTSVERGFDIPVEITGLPENLVITSRSDDEVNVRVMGRRSALRSVSPAALSYKLELAGAKAGVMTIDVDASGVQLPRGTRLVSRSPSRIELVLTERGSKAVRVRPDLAGEPAPGFVLASVEVEPQRVRITGARAEVLRLSEVVTETIDIEGAEADVEREVRASLGGRNIWLEDAERIRVRVDIEAEAEPEAEPGADAAEETTG